MPFDFTGLVGGMSLEGVLAFTAASILIELTPGPNMTYLAIVAAGEGRRSGLLTVLGVSLGLLLLGAAAALGVTAAVNDSAIAYQALRWAGVAYLLWLAFDGWRRSARLEAAGQNATGFSYFKRGFITNLLNPKAAAFYVAVLPGFLPAGAKIAHSLLLTAIYVGAATAIHVSIVILAAFAEPFLNDPRRERIARRVLSIGLACVAIWFGIKSAR